MNHKQRQTNTSPIDPNGVRIYVPPILSNNKVELNTKTARIPAPKAPRMTTRKKKLKSKKNRRYSIQLSETDRQMELPRGSDSDSDTEEDISIDGNHNDDHGNDGDRHGDDDDDDDTNMDNNNDDANGNDDEDGEGDHGADDNGGDNNDDNNNDNNNDNNSDNDNEDDDNNDDDNDDGAEADDESEESTSTNDESEYSDSDDDSESTFASVNSDSYDSNSDSYLSDNEDSDDAQEVDIHGNAYRVPHVDDLGGMFGYTFGNDDDSDDSDDISHDNNDNVINNNDNIITSSRAIGSSSEDANVGLNALDETLTWDTSHFGPSDIGLRKWCDLQMDARDQLQFERESAEQAKLQAKRERRDRLIRGNFTANGVNFQVSL